MTQICTDLQYKKFLVSRICLYLTMNAWLYSLSIKYSWFAVSACVYLEQTKNEWITLKGWLL